MAWIEKRGKGYRISVSCGLDEDNRQVYERITWTPSPGTTERQIEKELRRQEVLFEQCVKNGLRLDGNIRFSEFSKRWVEDYANTDLKQKTVNRYLSMLPEINREIGHLKLEKIQPHHIQAFNRKLKGRDRLDTKYMGKSTLKKALAAKELTRDRLAKEAGLARGTVINAFQESRHVSKKSAETISAALDGRISDYFMPVDKGAKLDPRTVLNHFRLISSILSTAVDWQLIPSNPCKRMKAPKVAPKESTYLDEKAASETLAALDSEPIKYRTMGYILLFCGVRRGELCGLEWPDISFDHNIVGIFRNSLYTPEIGIYTDTLKSASGLRAVKGPNILFDVLREYRAWQNEERLKLGSLWHDTDRLFTQWDGKPIHPDTVTNWFRDFIDRHNLQHFSPQSLRHTNATLQIAGGVPITTVSSRLGHAKPTTTMSVYAHAIKTANERAAEILDDMLRPTDIQRK